MPLIQNNNKKNYLQYEPRRLEKLYLEKLKERSNQFLKIN